MESSGTAAPVARELAPRGIHVAHLIVDAAIDTAFIRDNFPERYALRDQDGIVDPEHIAETYWMLHRQPSSWTVRCTGARTGSISSRKHWKQTHHEQ